MTEVRDLNANSVVALLDLRVRPDQDNLVAPNDVTLAQAVFQGGSEVRGIYDGDTPVGLLAIIDTAHPDTTFDPEAPKNAIYVWRFMIDAAHQGKGHGTHALAFVEQLARDRGRASILLDVVPDDASATPLYERHGYVKTGRVIDGEHEMAKTVL